MSDPNGQISHVASLSTEETAVTLLRIAAGLRRGRLRLKTGDVEVNLRPTRSVRFELHVRGASAHVGGRIDVDMSWTRLPAEPPTSSGRATGNGPAGDPPSGSGTR